MIGLKKTPRRKQKYSFGAIFGYTPIEELPDKFDLGEPLEIKNQKGQTCVAQSLCAVSEYQEGIALEPAYTIQLISQQEGQNWINEGTTLEAGAKTSLKGFLTRENSPHSVEKHGLVYCANPANWPTLYDKMAEKHKKAKWFWIGTSRKLKMFDAIRGAMYRFKDEKRAVQTGVVWNNSWTYQVYINKRDIPIGGHAICITGWNGEFLKVQNSYGRRTGDNGSHYIHKDIVNKGFKFGALMYRDMDMTHKEIVDKSKFYRSFLRQLLAKLLCLLKCSKNK